MNLGSVSIQWDISASLILGLVYHTFERSLLNSLSQSLIMYSVIDSIRSARLSTSVVLSPLGASCVASSFS